jgi:ABC-type lipoprotein release transport system permease subunit
VTVGRLILRNLAYHWRAHAALLLGVALGTAVLTGALVLGDSLRDSLRERALTQLAWVDDALVANRLLREELVDDLVRSEAAAHICPVLMLQGAATHASAASAAESSAPVRRAGQVTILGVDARFWNGTRSPEALDSSAAAPDEVLINAAVAEKLDIGPGDTITLHLQTPSAVPREGILGRPDAADVMDKMNVRVAAVLKDDDPFNRFSLHPSALPSRTVYVPLRLLQERLRQAGRTRGSAQQTSLGIEHPINGVLARGGTAAGLQAALAEHLTLVDWGLRLRDPQERARVFFASLDRNHDGKLTRAEWPRLGEGAFRNRLVHNPSGSVDRADLEAYYCRQHPYLSLESRQLFLEPAVARAASAAAADVGLRAAPTLVYLADSIAANSQEMAYAVVAALDPTLPAPLGSFLPRDRPLRDDEIVLTDWKESPLSAAKAGDSITLKYYGPEEQDPLREAVPPLHLAARIPLEGAADDPDLAPEFPGITDQASLADWDPPPALHYKNARVKPRDEEYWKNYRATPKAYVTLATGQRLWGSRFGNLTSIRLAAADSKDLSAKGVPFQRALLKHLRPEEGGLVFEAVRERAVGASAGSTDFEWLFLAFSGFLIAAALLLIGLLVRLNLDRRASELGLLLAVGMDQRRLRRLMMAEGVLLAAAGGCLGLLGSLFYATWLLELLRVWWPGGQELAFLHLHAHGVTLLEGYVASLLVSAFTILWAVRILGRVTPRALLAGETAQANAEAAAGGPRWSHRVALVAAVGAIALLPTGWLTTDQELRAMAFFGSGALALVVGLAVVWTWMRSAHHRQVGGSGGAAVARLGIRNAARQPGRSLLTMGLLASAAFVLVAVESFHREPDGDLRDLHSGSGGFTLLAESTVPLYQDLQSPERQQELNFPASAADVLANVAVFSSRLRAGDDTSCLNLYRPNQPQLLGVPAGLIERGGFRFQDSEASSTEERANPWKLLERSADEAIPVIADANTVQWILKTKLGGTLAVRDGMGNQAQVRIVGVLAASIFQSQLVMSEASFLKLFPRQEGYNFFLIATPPGSEQSVQDLLETALAERGFEVSPAARRLAAYLAVENTYLLTFQALGGLGLMLGALGLAIVLVRTVWERRGELALLRALGFRRTALEWLVLAENSFLLVLGLAVGTIAALLAVAPPLLSGTGTIPWWRLGLLLALVLAAGLSAASVAVVTSLRAPLVPALRRE